MLVMGQVCGDETEGRARCARAIEDGSALDRFRGWIAAQGGDPSIADDTTGLALAPCMRTVTATTTGFVAGFDAEGVGRSAMFLGAGRATKDDVVDLGAGLLLAVRVGDAVEPGTVLCTMYAQSESLIDVAEERFRASVHVGSTPVAAPPLFHEL